MVTEQTIRAALERMADQAPDPERIRAGLANRSRRYHQRRALLIAGGAAAAVGAVGVPTVMALRPRDQATIGGAGAGPVTLSYRPDWLPEGLVEWHRQVSVRDGRTIREVRSWSPSDALARPGRDGWLREVNLGVRPAGEFDPAEGAGTVTVGGATGWLLYHHGGDQQEVLWPAGDGMVLFATARAFEDDTEVALRVAESTVRDGRAAVEPPVRLGWLPDGVDRNRYGISVSSGQYGVETSLAVGGDGGASLSIYLGGIWGGPQEAPDQRRSETIQGRSVLLYRFGHRWRAHMVVAGRNVVLDAAMGISDDDLLRVCEELRIHPPDTGWMDEG